MAPPFDLPLSVVGLVFLAYLAGTGSSTVAGRAADALGRPRVVLVSVLVMAAGLALTLPDRLPWVIVGLVVFTGGFFAAHATSSGWAPVVGAPYGTRASALYVARLLRRLQRVRHRARRRLVDRWLARRSWSPSVRWCWSGRWRRSRWRLRPGPAISSPSRAPSSSSSSSPDQKLPGS